MKKFLKYLAIAFLFLTVLLYLFYRYRKVANYQVSTEETAYIETKIFGKDSENRGYSDRAKKLMDEDLAIYRGNPKMKKWYDLYLKEQRKMALASSKEEYLKSYIHQGGLLSCMSHYSLDLGFTNQLKNALKNSYSLESEEYKKYINSKHNKYTRTLSYQEESKLYNTSYSIEECNEIYNK